MAGKSIITINCQHGKIIEEVVGFPAMFDDTGEIKTSKIIMLLRL